MIHSRPANRGILKERQEGDKQGQVLAGQDWDVSGALDRGGLLPVFRGTGVFLPEEGVRLQSGADLDGVSGSEASGSVKGQVDLRSNSLPGSGRRPTILREWASNADHPR